MARTASMQERTSRLALGGAIAGTAASVVMMTYAMVAASTYQDAGFFTPLYHIASTFTEPGAMEASMKHAMAGDSFHLDIGPAALGVAIHLGTGAVLGAVFGVLIAALRSPRLAALPLGLGYGLVVLAVMSFVILPVAAETFGGGKAISDMPDMVGWGTFSLEHLIFGLVLGLWPLLRPGPVQVRRRARTSLAADAEEPTSRDSFGRREQGPLTEKSSSAWSHEARPERGAAGRLG